MFASAVARHYGLADDLVEDLKLAVSEAATDPVQAVAGGDISLAIRADGGGLACEIRSRSWERRAGAEGSYLPEDVDPALLDRLQLVRGLFANAERSEESGAITVRFSTASRAVT